jgi:putative membrane protein
MDRRLVWFCALLAPVLGWSAIAPHDYFTWFLEIVPVFIGLPLALALHRRFPLSSLLLVLLWWHSVILIFGGHYTYARVPLGDWAMHWFGWTRNNYDKLGHFAQGFVPAIFVRELLLRTSPLGPASAFAPFGKLRATADRQGNDSAKPSRWLGFLIVSVCLAFSALYELIEWLVAVSSGGAADDFLGTQGDPWDTQTDMAMALVGAIVAVLVLPRWHDRSMAKLTDRR